MNKILSKLLLACLLISCQFFFLSNTAYASAHFEKKAVRKVWHNLLKSYEDLDSKGFVSQFDSTADIALVSPVLTESKPLMSKLKIRDAMKKEFGQLDTLTISTKNVWIRIMPNQTNAWLVADVKELGKTQDGETFSIPQWWVLNLSKHKNKWRISVMTQMDKFESISDEADLD